MNEFAFVTRGSVFNEALARSRINIIMTLCIGEEKRLALNQISAHTTLSAQSSSRPATPTLNVAPMALQFETRLSSLVTFKKEKRILQGVADYTLCYDGDEQMGINLVLMESKRKGALSLAEGQLVAYMGMVHRTREAQRKRNKVVYGLSTDGNQFQFWGLDNSSEICQLTHSRVYGWDGGDSVEIVSFIRFIVRAALHSSPSTSPIKGAAEREVSLQAFSDPDKSRSFDYEIGRLSLAGKDGVGSDMEIV
ncbi:MAG: hypothetical protein M1839_001337 [Geoglossum umbratile]|nr:MAG: hypothetical protein M1839_001337 [Geoglossum umbratile]